MPPIFYPICLLLFVPHHFLGGIDGLVGSPMGWAVVFVLLVSQWALLFARVAPRLSLRKRETIFYSAGICAALLGSFVATSPVIAYLALAFCAGNLADLFGHLTAKDRAVSVVLGMKDGGLTLKLRDRFGSYLGNDLSIKRSTTPGDAAGFE